MQGRQQDYFDYFYDAVSATPSRITGDARRAYQAAYATDSALTASFDWYRALGLRDAGVTHVQSALVPGAAHFTQEEAPAETWRLISRFAQG